MDIVLIINENLVVRGFVFKVPCLLIACLWPKRCVQYQSFSRRFSQD